ncbi:hypothetical protein GCM10023350_08050 [Nocardioides endophyticus]|uniref:Uncharacterized protein n=1 Tax=Nocardioides endophyticus TaxID=1353775 RepID=A0ABP8YF48_9ACTN
MPAQDPDVLAQPTALGLQRPDHNQLLRRRAGTLAAGDLGLDHPATTDSLPRHRLGDMVAAAGMLLTTNLNEIDDAGLRFIVGSVSPRRPSPCLPHPSAR